MGAGRWGTGLQACLLGTHHPSRWCLSNCWLGPRTSGCMAGRGESAMEPAHCPVICSEGTCMPTLGWAFLCASQAVTSQFCNRLELAMPAPFAALLGIQAGSKKASRPPELCYCYQASSVRTGRPGPQTTVSSPQQHLFLSACRHAYRCELAPSGMHSRAARV